MVELKITKRNGEKVTIPFGHGREAITEAQAEAARVLTNRQVADATVTGLLDY